jgi:hypothetical protein
MTAFVEVDFSGYEKKMEKALGLLKEAAEEGMEDATKGAIRAGRRAMQVRGTYGSAKRFAGLYGRFAGPGLNSGRIDSGEMFYSLDREVDISGNIVRGRVGWLDNFQKYFLLQEEGFNYVQNEYPISGKDHRVEGMFIFRDMQTLLNQTSRGLIGSRISRKIKNL